MDLLQFNKDNPPPVGTPDAKGTPWDPAKHQAKVHPKTLRWLPRSPGRGHAGQSRLPGVDTPQAPAAAPADPTPPPAPGVDPAAQSLPPAPAAAPSFADIEAAAKAGETPAGDASAPGAKPAAIESTPETDAQAIMAIEALEFFTGSFTGEHEEARMEKGRRSAMVKLLSRWFAQKGWVAVGGVMLFLFLLSYFMETAKKEKTRAKLREMWARWRKKKPAEKPAEVLAVQTIPPAAPAVATPPPAATTGPAPRPFFAQ